MRTRRTTTGNTTASSLPPRRNIPPPANGKGPSSSAASSRKSAPPPAYAKNTVSSSSRRKVPLPETGKGSPGKATVTTPVKNKDRVSNSPLRRSGRLEQGSKSEQNVKNKESSKSSDSSGMKAGKKRQAVSVPSNKSPEANVEMKNMDGPANGREFIDARSFRAVYEPHRKKHKEDTPVPSKKLEQGNSVEDKSSKEKHNAVKYYFKKGRVHKNSMIKCRPDNTRVNESTTDGADAYVSGDSKDPIPGNEKHIYYREQSATYKCEVTGDKEFPSRTSKRSLDLMEKQLIEEDNTAYKKKRMFSKCRNSSQQSSPKDLTENKASGTVNVGESHSLLRNGDRLVEPVDSVSEECSVPGDICQDGGGDVPSPRLSSAKCITDSDASVTSSRDENFMQGKHLTDAVSLPIGRGNTEADDGAIGADESTRFPQNNGPNKDDVCPICELPDTQLLCKGKDCSSGYHLSCVDPPLLEVPPGIWLCLRCVRKKLDLGIYSISDGIESIWDSKVVEAPSDSGLQEDKQYLVKYAGLAHVHNRWISEKEALSEAPDLVAKYNKRCRNDTNALWRKDWCKPQRLLQKRLIMSPELIDEYFCCDSTDALPPCYYEWFVKWTGLGYEHASWELENSSFLNTHEVEVLVKELEERHNAAKNAYDPSKSDTVKKIRKKQFIKLSTLPDGFSVGFDVSYLNSLNKLRESWHKSSNSVLANDQDRIVKVMMFISTLLSDVCQPFLVITSSDSIALWESEFLRIMPTLNVVIYDGPKDARKVIRNLEFYEESGCIMFKVLLSHADAIIEDFEDLGCLRWEVVVVDDCQLPQVSKHLEKLKNICSECRLVLLSGQLRESIVEYVNLLSFIDSEDGQNSISSDTDTTVKTSKFSLLKQKFEKHCIGERKQEQSKFLEYWAPVHLSNVQLEQYCATLVSNSIILRSPSKVDQVGEFRDILLSARKCCDHPFLVESSLNGSLTKGLPPAEHLDVGVHASGKLRLLDKILQEFKNRGLRVLVLFQVTNREGKVHIGDILDDFLRFRFGAESYERVDSGLAMSKKQASLQKFNNKESGRFVFLLENRACLPSIKLSAVDAVIIFGSDWNPLNDIKVLQKINISSRFEQIKIFRLYSVSTIEEMVLLQAKRDVILESNIPNISRSTGHSLLRWGAIHLFDKLEEFHKGNSPSSICLKASSDKPRINDTFLEILQQLTHDTETVRNDSCSIISEVKQSGMAYSKSVFLFGESEKVSDEDQPHLFWAKLLEGRHPQWRYITGPSQRARRKVQNLSEQPLHVTDENDETKRKRKKVVSIPSDDNSIQAQAQAQIPPQDETKDDPIVEEDVLTVPQANDDPKFDSEGSARLQNLQRSLFVRLKPDLVGLCAALQLSIDVKEVAEMFLEYIMNNHHVNQEPRSLLEAFMVSLCWRAANFLRIKVDRKESLHMARKILNLECNEEEAESVYSKLRMLKKKFPRPKKYQLAVQSTPSCLESQKETFLAAHPSSEHQKAPELAGPSFVENFPVKTEKDSEFIADLVSNEHIALRGNCGSNSMENLNVQVLEHIQVGSSLECQLETSPLFASGDCTGVPSSKVTEVMLGDSFQSGAENGYGKTNHQVLHPEICANICSSIDISMLQAQPEVHVNGHVPYPLSSASRRNMLPSGHENAASAREENEHIGHVQSADAAPLPDSAEPSLFGQCGNPKVVLDVRNCQQDYAPDCQSLDPLDVPSAYDVGHPGQERCDNLGGHGDGETVSDAQPFLKSSQLADSECDGEQAEPPTSESVHSGQALPPYALSEVPTQQLTHKKSIVEDHPGSCPILVGDQIVVSSQSDGTCGASNCQENIIESRSSVNPLLELHNILPPANEQGQINTSMPKSNAQLQISSPAAQSIPSVENASSSGSSQTSTFSASLSTEGVGVRMQSHNVPLATGSSQVDQLVTQDLSQPMTRVHTDSQQVAQPPFQMHASLPSQGQNPCPIQQPFQIHASLPSQGLQPIPLQNELLRISKEKERIQQAYHDRKLKLRMECMFEIENLKKKYALLLQNVDGEFAELKNTLDTAYSKVAQNQVLAEVFRSNFSECSRTATAQTATQGAHSAAYCQPHFGQRAGPSFALLRNHPVTSAAFHSIPIVAPSQRSSAMVSTAPTNLPIPSLVPSQRIPPIPSAARTPVPIPSVIPSQRIPIPYSAPTQVPGVSARPTALPSVSARPTSVPSVSARPTSVPSVSARPTAVPSVSARPTAVPSPSAIIPTAVPAPSAAPTTVPGPSAIPTAVPSPYAIPTAVPIPSLASPGIPRTTSSVLTAASGPVSSLSTQSDPSPPFSAATSITAASILTQRISPISSAVPPVVSIPSIPLTAWSGSESQATVSAPLQASIPRSTLQTVNGTSALFSSSRPPRPFVGGMPLPRDVHRGNSLYRSPAPHLSFRAPPSMRSPSPFQSGGASSSERHVTQPSLEKSSKHSAAPHAILNPVSLQPFSTSRTIPASSGADGIQSATTSSTPATNVPTPSVQDVPSSGKTNKCSSATA